MPLPVTSAMTMPARPGPVAEREHVEEVAADLARRLVVGRDLEAAERRAASAG